ncbi:hypothetical protein DID88_010391 [Monilinia fructigena]|uniref:Uncharacterized protein n=1 Tax=Monilinia fructigena TaxID=38457 RepID=A0A395ILA1_9HELO|nr:hypothetical protein DID88_010391 [Monilinia fructigena]
MANYNFKISYVKGSENARADALSRKPEYQENKSYESYAIFKKEGESLVYNAPQLAATHILEDNHLRIKIQSHYDKDATAIRIRKTIEPGFTIENETIYFHGKVYIPSSNDQGIRDGTTWVAGTRTSRNCKNICKNTGNQLLPTNENDS